MASLGFEWKSVKGDKKQEDAENEVDEPEFRRGSRATNRSEDGTVRSR